VFHGTESRAGRFGPRKQVVTLHEVMHLWLPGFVDGPGAAWRREAYATLVAAADRVITVSAFEREKILEHLKLPPDRVVAVPLAAGPSFAPPEPGAGAAVRRRLGLEGPYVLSVGLAQPRKNTVRLVQAFAQVQTEAVLVLAGSTHAAYEAELAAACAPLGARVRRLGYVGPDDLPALYAGAWATAVPSLYESFGIPVLEAMACGSPVACASSGSLPEVAGDAALQFDPLDLDAISSALTKLCGDEALRARLAAAGRARAATFSVDRTARETTAVYTSL
jgi:alpha-1,3-rhamnosyl/mannosyltransferase